MVGNELAVSPPVLSFSTCSPFSRVLGRKRQPAWTENGDHGGDWTISGGCSTSRWPLSMVLFGVVFSPSLLLDWCCSIRRCGGVVEVLRQPSLTVRVSLRQCTFVRSCLHLASSLCLVTLCLGSRFQRWWRLKVVAAVNRGGGEVLC